MTNKQADAVLVSTSLIAWLGWWDFWKRGGAVNAMIGAFGTAVFVASAVHVWREMRR